MNRLIPIPLVASGSVVSGGMTVGGDLYIFGYTVSMTFAARVERFSPGWMSIAFK